MLNIKIILGSTREGRISEVVGKWILGEIKKKGDIEAEILDLRDYPLLFFDQATLPAVMKEPYKNEVARKWVSKIGESDGFVIIAPEYNHGYPAVLKNALDYPFYEWNRKPVGFVGYGGVGGARSIEQLRQVAIQLQMAPIGNSINIQGVWTAFNEKSEPNDEKLNSFAEKFIEEMVWWGNALKTARAK